MATSPNFSWPEPDNTDLVKNGALAIRTAINAIDTSMVDLKGGTTGQVLAKATNTDMDFSWVAQDDSNAIQNAIVDAKGDIIAATANDTPARLAVGANDTVLTADSSAATGLKWATPASGGLTLLSTTTLSTATTTVSGISGSYKDLQVVIYGISASTAMSINFNINSSATGAYYTGYRVGNGFAGAFLGYGNNTTLQMNQGATVASGNTSNIAVININNYASTTMNKYFTHGFIFYTGTDYANTSEFGMVNNTAAITSFTVTTSTGTFSGGTILVYGVK